MPPQTPSTEVAGWLQELSDAAKREKDWRQSAADLVTLYECGRAETTQFNILYSNTETLAPALYNNLPRPDVRRRFHDDRPVAKVGALVIQRTLSYLLDNGSDASPSADELFAQAVLEALVPGRGLVWFRYDAQIVEEQLTSETVVGEFVPWDRFYHGYAKHWRDVPWIAREHFMSREELKSNFGDSGAQVQFTISSKASNESSSEERDSAGDGDDGEVMLAQVFEIWDKASREVLFIAPTAPAAPIKRVNDPLGLQGFFPIPKPLTFFDKIKDLTPVPLYEAYRQQAEELNTITLRINRIVKALKVRGFYDSTLEGLDKLLSSEDNTLIPAENVAALQQGLSLEKAIYLMPIEKLISVLQQLYIQREQVKTVIYEITGISDILRGASVASETATAQNIKNQWGTLRLKRMQKKVSVFVRDCLRLMTEIACTKLSPETIGEMTDITLPSEAQKAQAQALLGQAQATPNAPPQVAAQLEKLQSILSQPSVEEVTALLRSDTLRAYRVEVETNSTVDAEATEDKQNMGEFLNAISQYFNGIAPMVQSGTLPFNAAKAILLGVTRRYRFGTDVEDEIAKMAAPQQPAQDPKAQEQLAKAQEELQAKELELEMARKEFELEKRFAAKEIDMMKKMAMKEIEMEKSLAVKEYGVAMREQSAAHAAANSAGLNSNNPAE